SQKRIKIGVRLSQPPFSVLDGNGNFEGFEVELAKKIGEKIIGRGAKIELVGVNANDRVKFLNDNVADLMIANFTQ
ncbi:transporter substrate-binding domain-containing protein, partial [Campylobacter sp. FMV-PI01]